MNLDQVRQHVERHPHLRPGPGQVLEVTEHWTSVEPPVNRRSPARRYVIVDGRLEELT